MIIWYFIGCIISFIMCIYHIIETDKYYKESIYEKNIFYPIGLVMFFGFSWFGVLIILLNMKYDKKTCIR
jgi:hypothetical protein